jgi:hypothetical protein
LQRLSAWRRWIDQQLSGLPAATGHFSGQRVLIALRQLGAIRQWSLRYAVAPPLLATPRHHDTLVLTTAYSDSIFTEADLYRVASEHYYCARRRLRRRLRTRERRAVDAVISERPSRLAWVDLSGHASSLVLWRVAWEKPHAAPASFQPYSERNHTPTNVMLWLATRPLSFDIETISSSIERLDREFADSYQRCRALAKWMQSRGDPMLSLNALRLPLPRHCLRWDA